MSGSIPVRLRDGGGLHVRWMTEMFSCGTPLSCRGGESRPVIKIIIILLCTTIIHGGY